MLSFCGNYLELEVVVVSALASQQEDPGFNSRVGAFRHGVCRFSLCLHGFSPASSQKHVNWG